MAEAAACAETGSLDPSAYLQSMQLSLSFPGERKVPPDQLPDSGPLDGLTSYAESYWRKQIPQQPKPQNQKPEGPVAPPFDGESRYSNV